MCRVLLPALSRLGWSMLCVQWVLDVRVQVENGRTTGVKSYTGFQKRSKTLPRHVSPIAPSIESRPNTEKHPQKTMKNSYQYSPQYSQNTPQ